MDHSAHDTMEEAQTDFLRRQELFAGNRAAGVKFWQTNRNKNLAFAPAPKPEFIISAWVPA